MSAHSTIVGGSSAERVLACSGSIRLVREAINKSSSYAKEGTALHEAMEHILHEGLQPVDVQGMTFHGHQMTLPLIDECLRPAVQAFEKIVGERPFELEVAAPLVGVDGAFGTSDVVYFDDDDETLLGIVDWKFGSGHAVRAAGNSQMMFYLYSQMMRADIEKRAAKLKATIVQPRLGVVDTADYTATELTRFVFALSAAVSGPEVFRKGDWCHWCPGKPRCPEWWGKRVEKLQRFTVDRPSGRVVT